MGGDAGYYQSAGNLIAHGRFLYRGIFGHAYVTAEHPPLFSLAVAVLYPLVTADGLVMSEAAVRSHGGGGDAAGGGTA